MRSKPTKNSTGSGTTQQITAETNHRKTNKGAKLNTKHTVTGYQNKTTSLMET